MSAATRHPSTAPGSLAGAEYVAVAWLLGLGLEPMLRVAGLHRTVGAVERLTSCRARRADSERAEDHRRAVAHAFRWLPFEGTCLRRALVELSLGRLRGLDVSLVVGVRAGAAIAAHAWTVCSGVPPRDAADFAEIYRSSAS
jgi:hypothetical protein